MEHVSPVCISISFADIGGLAGIVDLPHRLLILAAGLHPDHRASVARSLLDAAGLVQPQPYDATCPCGRVLCLDDQAAAVS